MPFSRASFVAKDLAVAFLSALVAGVAVYWVTDSALSELGIVPPIDPTGLFTIEQWEERYMRTTLQICLLASLLGLSWAILGSWVWPGVEGDGRVFWVLGSATAGAVALAISWQRLPLTASGGNAALMLQAAAGLVTFWLATLFGAPRNFQFTPLGARWLRTRLPW